MKFSKIYQSIGKDVCDLDCKNGSHRFSFLINEFYKNEPHTIKWMKCLNCNKFVIKNGKLK